MMYYELDANLLKDYDDEAKLIWYNSRENSTNNERQREFRANSVRSNRENNTVEFRPNSTKNYQKDTGSFLLEWGHDLERSAITQCAK